VHFTNPKTDTDIAFKKIFGTDSKREILIYFLVSQI